MYQHLTIVTGGGRGIGAATSRRLARDGHDLVISYLHDSAAAEHLAQEARQLGRKVLVVQVDTTVEASVTGLFARAEDFGTVTGLVNNAGSVGAVGPLSALNLQQIRADIDVNLMAVIACCKLAISAMRQGGSIVNLSSAAATLGSAGTYVHYAAAKAAIDVFTLGLATELAPQGIRVNAVAPGIIWTDFHQDPERPSKLASSIPMGRAGTAEEVASAIAWLLSPEASYTTGTVLRVAGGR